MSDIAFQMLLDTIKDPVKLNAFLNYLGDRLCDENLLFYLKVEEFHQSLDIQSMRLLAERIYCEYIESGAPKCINIDDQIVKEISTKIELEDITAVMFDRAQKFVFDLMVNSLFPGFLKSNSYMRICHCYENRILSIELFTKVKQMIEAGSWNTVSKKKTVDISYKRISEGKSDRHFLRGTLEITDSKTVLDQLRNTSSNRREWDKGFINCKTLEKLNPDTDIVLMSYKSKRDKPELYTLLLTYKELEEDSSFVLFLLNVKYPGYQVIICIGFCHVNLKSLLILKKLRVRIS